MSKRKFFEWLKKTLTSRKIKWKWRVTRSGNIRCGYMCPITAVNYLVTGKRRSIYKVEKAIEDLGLGCAFGNRIIWASDDSFMNSCYRDKMLRILKLEK